MYEPILYTDAPNSGAYPLGLCAAGYHVVALVDGGTDVSAFGRGTYDFRHATLLFLAPGRAEVFAAAACCAVERTLAFDPVRFRCTGLDRTVGEYAFFRYLPAEMLHLAACETRIVTDCMEDIRRETLRREDLFSCRVQAQQIGLLLDHCARMYERQFITRELAARPLLTRYETFVTRWIESGRLGTDGEPSDELCSAETGLSPAYLGSLLRFEKGYGHAEYVQFLRLETARRLLDKAGRPAAEVARLLGFPSERCFRLFYRKVTGCPLPTAKC